ncbi:16S rRNA (cytosine(967)-C(5))-methyltransferase RsmB [Candidatus Vallotia cooleyia]|uniref:16S rRNA (cytosine(967)-C(5))-methyltransferase RsmB n=1 Tax=Candidatus Vallotiella adelgis TaxID=1177211 RepID=UPI001D002780|nr:16S rRNA (cytosine(967)-C(5))-methyltransferase RsmB [Candidatus Vallotia cooleyia]UDG82604.1 Ribosomal RNA small subunit methyltransferase B [Candidatus Vallotia cooleyia]
MSCILETQADYDVATTTLRSDSLAFALDGAARTLTRMRAGTALPAALAIVHANIVSAQARGAIQDLAYRATRQLARADVWLATLVRRPPAEHVANVLRCAFSLLAEPDIARTYSDFTVVDQAVDAIAARSRVAHTKGLVNAVLRNMVRSRSMLLDEAMLDPVTRWNYPRWWIDTLRHKWPNDVQRFLEIGNEHAPMTLRINRRRSDVVTYFKTLRASGIDAFRNSACFDTALTLRQPMSVEYLPGFSQGVVSVQDAGVQRAAALLDVRDGMRVLDACAAPGGKTGHLLECADIELVALERDAVRAMRIKENLARLQLCANIQIGDAGEPCQWYSRPRFDRILADVPCSASGIVRRHPDIRWLRRPTDIATLVAEQRRIVQAIWPLLKRGGKLLYTTCSIFPEEGEQQAAWFEHSLKDAIRLNAPGYILPIVASSSHHPAFHHEIQFDFDQDGFFYACFQKQ